MSILPHRFRSCCLAGQAGLAFLAYLAPVSALAPVTAFAAPPTTVALSTTRLAAGPSTTSTTIELPAIPVCADVTADGNVTASDALGVLLAAVDVRLCGRCVCDLDDSGAVLASDALLALGIALGAPIVASCPEGGQTATWSGGGNGHSWEDAANWSAATVPDPCDVVRIDAPSASFRAAGNGGTTVDHATGRHGALAVYSSLALHLSGGSLSVAGPLGVAAPLVIGSATLSQARVLAYGGPPVELIDTPILDGVTFQNDVESAQPGTVASVTGGLTVAGIVRLGPATVLRMRGAGEQSIVGQGEIRLDGDDGADAAIEAGDADTIARLGMSLTVTGGDGRIGGDFGALVIDGTVAPTAGRAMLIDSNDWTNYGAISAAGGAITMRGNGSNHGTIIQTDGGRLTLGGNWHNAGNVVVVDSTLELGDSAASRWQNNGAIDIEQTSALLNGTFALADLGGFFRTGGEVLLVGVLDNAVGLVLDDARGDWIVANGGLIVGGAIVSTPAQHLVVRSGTLDGVRLDADVDVSGAGARAGFVNETVLNGHMTIRGDSVLTLDGGGVRTIRGTGEIELEPGAAVSTDADTLIIAPGMQVLGTGGTVGESSSDLNVNGRVETSMTGAPLTLVAGSAVNSGEIVAALADVTLSGAWSNNFRLIAEPGRTISASGPLALNLPGSLSLRIASPSSVGKLSADGPLALGGTFEVTFTDDYEPQVGDTFRVIDYESTTGAFDVLLGLDIGNGKALQQNYEPDGLTLEVIAQ